MALGAKRAFSTGRFGAGQRLPMIGFVVFGLVTFWIYTALRFAAALRAHLDRRWKEFSAIDALQKADAERLDALRREGFRMQASVPALVVVLLACDGLLVLWWFMRWVVVGDVSDYTGIMLLVGGSAALFYAAVLMLFLWALTEVRRHERVELLLREAGAAALDDAAPIPSNELLAHWERQTSEITLFLVVALPLTFSPAIGAHLFLTHWFETTPLVLPSACFVFAAVFHVWGSALLVRLFNAHLDTEAAHASPQGAPSPATAFDAPRAGHHDVFLSHSAKDKPVADAICARLEQNNIRVWIAPRDILPGSNWGEAIIQALESCRVMVVVFSSSANASPQVLREVERAVGKGVTVIPFRIEDVLPSKAMEYFLSSPHWLDALQPPLERHIEQLAQTVGVLIEPARQQPM